jgi:predicted nucleic acid-binding protein
MKYALDASVGLKWVLVEPDADKARRLRDDFQNQIHELIAPDSFPLECAHALARAERRGMIPDARKLWGDLMLDSPLLFPCLPLMDRALTIASQAHIGVYDASMWPWPSVRRASSGQRMTGLFGPSSQTIPSSRRSPRSPKPQRRERGGVTSWPGSRCAIADSTHPRLLAPGVVPSEALL